MKMGYDPQSRGLIKYETTNNNPKYTAVSSDGIVNKYIIKPEYFNESDVSFLIDEGVAGTIGTDIYVGDIQIKGFKTHSIFDTDLYQACDVKFINNPFTGESPKSYSDSLINGSADKFAPHQLNYGLTIQPFTIDIRDLPDIELDADTTITVNIGDLSFTRSLPHLLREDKPEPIINVSPSNQRANGFEFTGNFADVMFNGVYEKSFTQSSIVDGKTEHMIKNANKEEALTNSQIYQFATTTLGSLTDGFDILGGIGSALDAYLEYGLREAGFNDMAKQRSNIGGNMIHNAVGETVENLIQISYPIKKTVRIQDASGIFSSVDVYLGGYEVNNPKTFSVNRRFEGVSQFLTFVNSNFRGDIVGGDITPLFDYGDYTKYFKRVIELGGLQ